MTKLDHEKLDVYQLAIEFVIISNSIIKNFPRGNSYLADQLRRASSSITLNIAEGGGEFCKNEKVRFYRMAKRSATESAAILDISKRLSFLEETTHTKSRELLIRIVSMLTKMVSQ
jgi:four helix bundle protein